jgi:hypothetical protein
VGVVVGAWMGGGGVMDCSSSPPSSRCVGIILADAPNDYPPDPDVGWSPLLPQPDPVRAEGDVWAEIISNLAPDDVLRPLCVERRQQGIDRYGTPLQRGNGRDHVADALQEALDGAVYARAARCGPAEMAFKAAARLLRER